MRHRYSINWEKIKITIHHGVKKNINVKTQRDTGLNLTSNPIEVARKTVRH